MAKRSRTKEDPEPPTSRAKPQTGPRAEGNTPLLFPVVGLGGSAGALAALNAFFEAMPSDCGVAFVVVLHLSPEHESQLADLLQGHTSMTVTQVTARVTMAPNCVYVIPPAKNLTMEDGDLVLTDFEQPRGRRLPIDHFFRTHASEHPDGVAVVLSGGGADGTLGIKAVKEAGGLVMVQDPDEAEHPSMPRNAISTGVVDVVAPVAVLARHLMDYRDRLGSLRLPAEPDSLPADDEVTLHKILTRLQNRTGHDFTSYKRSTVLRRLGRRMHVHGLDTLGGYLGFLLGNQEEVEALFKDLLISVTQFFRDPETFEALSEHVLPGLVADRQGGEPLRVWVAGCATGEEAYSLAIVLLEYLAPLDQRYDLQVFATDIDEAALGAAREGHYPQAIEADVSEARLKRFFTWEGGRYRIRPEVRERVVFAPHNLLRDPPFSRIDLVTCRNLLIYLQRGLQEKVFDLFHYALRPGGFLMLGNSESADAVDNLFATVEKRHRFYRRKDAARTWLDLPELPMQGASRGRAPSPRPPRHDGEGSSGAEQHARSLERYAPPSALIDEQYDVLHLSPRAGRYLEHRGGRPSSNILQLVRPELEPGLRAALFHAFERDEAITSPPLKVTFTGDVGWVYLIVQPTRAQEEAAVRQALVLFAEVGLLDPDGREEALHEEGPLLQHLQRELLQTRGRLQSVVEEHETQHEELKAANEELQSINEEYRSATEELETSKEELQSVNEELQTVNHELKSKIEEISHAHTDLENLLASTEIATLFLDRALRIRRFTPNATHLFHLRESDTGRAIGEVKARMDFDGFAEDARQVLRTLEMIEREVADESNRRYLVRIRPYRTPEDKIDGVVLTFIDITERKRVEQALHRALSYAETLIGTIREPLLVLDANLRVQSANAAFCEAFAVKREEAEGAFIYELSNGQWDFPDLRRLLENVLPENDRMTNFEVTHRFESIGQRTMLLNARQLAEHQLILLAIEDVTRQHDSRLDLEASERRYRLLVEAVEEYAIFLIDEEGRVLSWNEGATRLLGYDEQEILGQTFAILFTEEDRAAEVPAKETAQARAAGKAADDRWQVRKGGSRFWASGVLTALPTENGESGGFVNILRDNTRRRASEEDLHASEEEVRALTEGLEERVEQRTKQVRRLASALVMAEQRERRRISAILHDHLQQLLFGAQMQVSFLSKDLPEGMRPETDTIIQTLREAIDVTRTLTVDLSPPVLKGEGLDAAMQWLAHQMQSLYNLKVEVRASAPLVVHDEDLRVLIFQLLRELLFNVVKHAGVHAACVELGQTDTHLHVSVIDQGAGFDVARTLEQSEDEGHFGLARIRERLALFDGTLEIASSPGEGTRATLSVPLQGT